MKLKQKIRHKAKKGLPILAALFLLVATPILAEWIALGFRGESLFEHYVPAAKNYQSVVIFAVFIFLIFTLYLLYRLREHLLQPRGFHEAEVTPHKCLIVPLSSPIRKDDKDVVITKKAESGYSITVKTIPIPNGQDIEQDIDSLKGTNWSWQQFLRGIAVHQNKLEVVYLIGTQGKLDGTPGSNDFLDAAEFLINNYMKNAKHVIHHPKAVNPDSFNPLCSALNDGVKKLKSLNYDEADIVIDVTGATKMVSIAGAAVTMNKDVMFQYVQTEADKNKEPKVLAYDVVAGRSAPSVE
jgi:hypothetical protein